MCQYFSCIVTRDLKVHWSKRTENHESIIEDLQLQDTKLTDRDFVRIEITPANKQKMTRNQDDWNMRLDEEKTIPDWYEKNITTIQANCWKTWRESVEVQISIGDENHSIKNMLAFAYDSSQVEAYDSSKVVAYGSSKVVANGSSKVEANGSSKVEANGSSQIVANGSSKVVAYGSSKVVAFDNSQVEANDSSQVVAYDNSQVEANDSSQVVANDNSKVELRSTMAVVLYAGKIIVHPNATVEKAQVFRCSAK